MSGNLEEVLDTAVVVLDGVKHLVAATTSPILQLRGLDKGHAILLEGHNAAVLSVSTWSGDGSTLVSGSRDQSVRLWQRANGVYTCVAVGTGHTEAVTGVRFGTGEDLVIYSCSEDRTVKCWRLEDEKLSCIWTKVNLDNTKK